MASDRTRALRAVSILLVSTAGCTRPPDAAVTVLVGDSKAAGKLRKVSLPSGREVLALPLGAPCGDLARGPAGEIYFSSGNEVFLLRSGAPLPLLTLEDRVDSVLPSRDGRRLYLLQHPPRGNVSGEDAGERDGPHRLRIWDLEAARFGGEVELHPRAYEIHEGPGFVLATHLLGRRIEIARLGTVGFAAESAEELRVEEDTSGERNQQACIRAAAVAPAGGRVLLVENGAGGEMERAVLWTLDLPGRTFTAHPLAARGFFQAGIAFLPPSRSGALRAALNGGDRLLLIEYDPARGVREEGLVPLPGFFHDLRVVAAGSRPGSGAPELILLAGSDRNRRQGYLAAVDIPGRKVAWVRQLSAAADVLEVE
jgi:hypothetical protein